MKPAWILIPVLSFLTPAIPKAAYAQSAPVGGQITAASAEDPSQSVAPASTEPDSLTSLPTGVRVRVDAPRLALYERRNPWIPIVGTFVSVRADTLEVQEQTARHGQPRLLAIHIPIIDRAERWRGRKGNGRLGMVVGLALGAGAGALFPSGEETYIEDRRLASAVLGGLGGILWGGVVGSMIKTDRWEKLALPGRAAGAP